MPLRGRSNLTDERVFFVTTTVINWTHVFTEDLYCDLLINNIQYYQQRYRYEVLGYVIMPSHFHWIVLVNPKTGTISDIMRDIKKYSAWDIMEALGQRGRSDLLTRFENAGRGRADRKRKFWHTRFDDRVLRTQSSLLGTLQYIHDNPVRSGLVDRPEAYKYSSARNYFQNDHSVLCVDTAYAAGMLEGLSTR